MYLCSYYDELPRRSVSTEHYEIGSNYSVTVTRVKENSVIVYMFMGFRHITRSDLPGFG